MYFEASILYSYFSYQHGTHITFIKKVRIVNSSRMYAQLTYQESTHS